MAIEKLNLTFENGVTLLDAAFFNIWQNKINEVIDAVNNSADVKGLLEDTNLIYYCASTGTSAAANNRRMGFLFLVKIKSGLSITARSDQGNHQLNMQFYDADIIKELGALSHDKNSASTYAEWNGVMSGVTAKYSSGSFGGGRTYQERTVTDANLASIDGNVGFILWIENYGDKTTSYSLTELQNLIQINVNGGAIERYL